MKENMSPSDFKFSSLSLRNEQDKQTVNKIESAKKDSLSTKGKIIRTTINSGVAVAMAVASLAAKTERVQAAPPPPPPHPEQCQPMGSANCFVDPGPGGFSEGTEINPTQITAEAGTQSTEDSAWEKIVKWWNSQFHQ